MTTPQSPSASSWEDRFTASVAASIEHYRERRGVSVQWLADRCSELGLPTKRSALAALLGLGTRRRISVQEIAIFARALEVPPLLLLFPVYSGERVEVLPGVEADAIVAAGWFEGRESASAMVPALGGVRAGDFDALRLYERYSHAAATFQTNNRLLAIAGHEAALRGDATSEDVTLAARPAWRALRLMREAREAIVAAGLRQPSLPPGLDDTEGWDEPSRLPAVGAVEALPGGLIEYPLVVVDADGATEVLDGPA